MSFVDDVKEKAQQYLTDVDEISDVAPSTMVVDFAIEKFTQKRNYPSSFTSEQIENDMRKNINTIAMAVVDILMKSGAEGETTHDENGIKRVYENPYFTESLFKDVLAYVKFI